MTREEIEKVLDLHKKWCNNEKNGEKADLHRADLREAEYKKLREA